MFLDSDLRIKESENGERIEEFKNRYLSATVAPLDGMWLCGFVPHAQNYEIILNGELVGFFCVNSDQYLLQFYIAESHHIYASEIFQKIVGNEISDLESINGVFVSTAEPFLLTHCFDFYSKFKVNALMYFHPGLNASEQAKKTLDLKEVTSEQIPEAVDFAVENLGASAEWLQGYYQNLVDRNELLGLWQGGRLIAAGEARHNDTLQPEVADVGMLVAKSERLKGLATQILIQLVQRNQANGLKSICSTESGNIAAQKAIGRAGFRAYHRILEFGSWEE